MWGAIAAAAGKSIRSGTPRRRRPRPISSGPKTGRRPGGRKKLTTSQAAIRRFEARKRGGTGRTQGKPLPGRGPRYTGGGGTRPDRRPTSRGPKRKSSSTSRIAIARSRNRLGPASSRRKSVGRFGRRVARSVRR